MNVLLRTMTLKSRFESGKYTGQTVEYVMSIDNASYLRFCYFGLEKITFTPELLASIGITEEYFIPKPGTNKQRFEDYKRDFPMQSRWANNQNPLIVKMQNEAFRRAEVKRNCKGRNQARNHGR